MDKGEEGGEYEVERILATRKLNGKRQYFLHWKGYTPNKATWQNEEDLKCDALLEEFRASRAKKPQSTRKRRSPKKGSEVPVQKAFRQSRLSHSQDDWPYFTQFPVTAPQAPAASNRDSSNEPAVKKKARTGTTGAADVSASVTQGSSTSRIVDPTRRQTTKQTIQKSAGRKGQGSDLPTTSSIPLNQNPANGDDSPITSLVQKAVSKARTLNDVQGASKSHQKVIQKAPAVTKPILVQNPMPIMTPFPTMGVTVNGNNDEDDDNIIDVVTVDETTHDLYYSNNDLIQKMALFEHPVLVQTGSGVTVVNKMGHLPFNDVRPVQKSTSPGLFVAQDDDDDVVIIDEVVGGTGAKLTKPDLHKGMPVLERMMEENPIPAREVDDDDDVVFIGETINTAPTLSVSLSMPFPVHQNAVVETALPLQNGNDDDDDVLIIEDEAVIQETTLQEKAEVHKMIAELFGENPADPDGDAAIAARDFTDCIITQDLRINGELYYNVKFADDSEELVKEHIISERAPGQWFLYTLGNLEEQDRKQEEAKKREEALQRCSKKLRRRL